MAFRNSRIVFAALAVLVIALVPALAQISTAKVTGGMVEGVVKDGIAFFKGIPFAAPPVGDLRWRSPQPVKPWAGVKKGDPNGPGLPVWPAFDEKEQKTMFFDKTPGARPHPNLDKLEAFDAHFARLREEARAKK